VYYLFGMLSEGRWWATWACVPEERATTILEQATSTEEVEAAKEAFFQRYQAITLKW
jgi:hypothetical protein